MIHRVEGFTIIDETDIDDFEHALAFSVIQQILLICSAASSFTKPSLLEVLYSNNAEA